MLLSHIWLGVFSNLLSHAGVQEYFQIDCRTRVSRTIFYLTVARGVQEYDWHCWHCWYYWTLMSTIEHYWTLMSTVDTIYTVDTIDTVDTDCWHYWTLMSTIEHYWTPLNTVEHCWTLLNTVEHCWTLLNTVEHCWTLLTWFTLLTWRIMRNPFIHDCLVPMFQWERLAEGWRSIF